MLLIILSYGKEKSVVIMLRPQHFIDENKSHEQTDGHSASIWRQEVIIGSHPLILKTVVLAENEGRRKGVQGGLP